METAKSDIQTWEDITTLVDRFYDRVRQDELLSPVFSHVDWPAHLPTMYSFWASLLLGDQSYKGNPLQKHLPLPIKEAHFDRWIQIFSETITGEFEGPKAVEALERAKLIANLFRHRMGLATQQPQSLTNQ